MAITLRDTKGTALTHAEVDNNFNELDKIPNGKVFPKESDKGIKIDTDNPDWAWEDVVGHIHIIPEAPSPATIQQYIGSIYETQVAENECAYIKFHMPHDYAIGTDIYIHVHWSHNSTFVTGGSVTWTCELSYAKGHNQGCFCTPINVAITQNANTTQYQHLIAETVCSDSIGSATTLNRNNIEPDGIILCKVCLDSNDLTTSNASIVNPFIHTADIHYQSTGIGTKNKEPNFYGV